MVNRPGLLIMLLASLLMGACRSGTSQVAPTHQVMPPTETSAALANTNIPTECQLTQVAYPSNNPAGNHWVQGRADLPRGRVVDVELGARPHWLVGLGTEAGSRWLVSDSTGQLRMVTLEEEQPLVLGFDETWPDEAPMAVKRVENGLELIGSQLQPMSPLTHPVQLSSGGQAAVSIKGQLLLGRDGRTEQVPLVSLPDARLLVDRADRILLLTNPTGRYDHGVLGDGVEAGSMTLVEAGPASIAWSVEAPGQMVFEGVAPLWVDMNGDGLMEVVATASDRSGGARYLLFGEGGQRLAASQPIGQGYRWRHAIAAATFGADGEMELVGVRTPHIGGIVEYFRWQDDQLVLSASLPGYSSHSLGSRNLDQALAGDFDSDGRLELLVPTQDQAAIGAIGRVENGAVEKWRLDLSSNLTTNLAVACHQGGALALGVGTQDGTLRFWLPER